MREVMKLFRFEGDAVFGEPQMPWYLVLSGDASPARLMLVSVTHSTGTVVRNGKEGKDGFSHGTPNATNDYWDIDTSGAASGCSYDCSGVTGLTTAQFQSGLPAGFDPAVWAQSPGINNGFPYLLANPPQ